jgi:hypothetical protein
MESGSLKKKKKVTVKIKMFMLLSQARRPGLGLCGTLRKFHGWKFSNSFPGFTPRHD